MPGASRESDKIVIKGPAVAAGDNNLPRAAQKSFRTSTSKAWNLQDLHARACSKSSYKDLHKIFWQGPVQDHVRISPGSPQYFLIRTCWSSCKDPWQDFIGISLHLFIRTSARPWSRVSYIPDFVVLEGLSTEFIGSLYQNLRETARISTAPQPEGSDTDKAPRGLRERSQSSHRATTRAILHAQSDERGFQIRTRPQRERSDRHKVMRRLREHRCNFHEYEHWKCQAYRLFRFQLRLPRKMSRRRPKCCACHAESGCILEH